MTSTTKQDERTPDTSGLFKNLEGRKWCRGCRETFPLTSFSPSTKSKAGLYTYCKTCVNARHRAWNAQNPERVHARTDRYYKRFPSRKAFANVRRRAIKYGTPLMARDEFCKWYDAEPNVCAYCGLSESDATLLFGHKLHVDRKNPKLGYVLGNICLACQRCNLVKSKYLTFDEMKQVAAMFFVGRTDGMENRK